MSKRPIPRIGEKLKESLKNLGDLGISMKEATAGLRKFEEAATASRKGRQSSKSQRFTEAYGASIHVSAQSPEELDFGNPHSAPASSLDWTEIGVVDSIPSYVTQSHHTHANLTSAYVMGPSDSSYFLDEFLTKVETPTYNTTDSKPRAVFSIVKEEADAAIRHNRRYGMKRDRQFKTVNSMKGVRFNEFQLIFTRSMIDNKVFPKILAELIARATLNAGLWHEANGEVVPPHLEIANLRIFQDAGEGFPNLGTIETRTKRHLKKRRLHLLHTTKKRMFYLETSEEVEDLEVLPEDDIDLSEDLW